MHNSNTFQSVLSALGSTRLRAAPFRCLLALASLTAVAAGSEGCVASRDSRNGVFSENQYIRKDFLVRPGNAGAADPGWFMKATIVQTSTPNPLANLDLFTGAENNGALVRFSIDQSHMRLLDMRELSNSDAIKAQNTRTPSVVNTWPVTNVDLKYRVNLDGETTNFYEENLENRWEERQWVKVDFAKNDLSDLAGLGAFQNVLLNKCVSVYASTSLVPDSFYVDDKNNYMQWTIAVTVEPNLLDKECVQMFGAPATDFVRMGRSNVTLNIMYSMTRAPAVDPAAYVPLLVDEKDAIRHKYGAIEITNFSRDLDSGLVAARELVVRYNPNKPIVWYLAAGYPKDKRDMWTRPGGIVDQTNAIFEKAGAKARITLLNYNDLAKLDDAKGPARQYGDVRYSFIRWESDLDTNSPFLGVAQFQPDLRTGEIVSASINIADAPLKDFVVQRVAAYLTKVIGSDPFDGDPLDPADPTKRLPASCTVGSAVPLLSSAVHAGINAQSTLYAKMALYLPPPPNGAASPGPTDYVYEHKGVEGTSFNGAYAALLPYITYADPNTNQFVTPADLSTPSGMGNLVATLGGETKFQQEMTATDHGKGLAGLSIGSGQAGMKQAYEAVDAVRQLWQAHREYTTTWQLPHSLMRGDTPDIVSFPALVGRASRHCTDVGGAAHWQTREEWQNALVQTYYESVVWHEFGHIMGLEHNFMASVDKANWPTYKAADGTTQYGKLSSSIMEYSVAYDDLYWNNGSAGANGAPQSGWLPYDQAGIAWIYGNNLSKDAAGPKPSSGGVGKGISGQVSATEPWNDPLGFKDTGETQFLFCSHQHLKYTPLCRQFDIGSTPSEIAAAEIEQYEFNYQWRNFRNYYKVWDDSQYATRVANIMGDTRRFIAMWEWDWSKNELTDKLIRIGIKPPSDAVNAGLYYTQLTDQFQADVGSAEQLLAAFHEAVIQQGTGQRPFASTYDAYFGDVTQQGIAIDKELAFINWLGLWPYDNYDPTQAAGYLGSSLTVGPGTTHPAQAWSAAASMLGEKGPWDAYPSFFPAAVALFAHDTHTPTFTGMPYPQMRDWIGGHKFKRAQDVLDYFHYIASLNPLAPNGCKTLESCTYNPMTPKTNGADIGHSDPATQSFIGPDDRRWIWVYLADRNIWFFVDQDRNPSLYAQMLTYNNDVFTLHDDGNIGPVYTYQARIKYMIDAFDLYNGDTTTN